MDDALLLLRLVDTPTVCNAIETAQGKREFDRYTYRSSCLRRSTARWSDMREQRIAARQASGDAPDIVRSAGSVITDMSEGPRPAIAVVEDVDVPNAVGAYWGEVNTTVHKAPFLTAR